MAIPPVLSVCYNEPAFIRSESDAQAMNAHSLKVLEFAQIREMLAEHASCALGKEIIAALSPLQDEEAIRRAQAQTTEARRLLEAAGQIPLGGVHDVRPAVRAAAIGAMLEPGVLLDVCETLAATRRLRAFLLKRAEEAPWLADIARNLDEYPQIEEEIRRCISEKGEVVDAASPALGRIRKEMRVAHGRMMEKLNSLIRSSGTRDMIQDPIVTMRDDRYCIPVKAEYRSHFGGLVHDQSASGATVFMEPTAVVELGNELRRLAIQERQEVERILRELSGLVGRRSDPLEATLSLLGEVDFIAARAKLSCASRATEPAINTNGVLRLRQARHPLLRGEVVPIDVHLGDAFSVLVITGPNTGGKTVTLKTVGLLTLMAQSGLHIPADEGSAIALFRGVYADIGDEQSIQQSLSTFSSHITHIARILEGVRLTGRHSLVLLDEIGAGTDPTEGAALARAIMGHLHAEGARCIATTHYGELKAFAYSHDGVENASVEFDLETLRPTYRLLIGIPGSSNAFTIAARLGLPEAIVEAARSQIHPDELSLTEVIRRLTEDQRATEQDLQRAAQGRQEIDALRERLERELLQLRADRQQTLERARAEAFEVVRAARREADRVIGELRRQEKAAQRGETGFSPADARRRVQKLVRELQGALPEAPSAPLPAPGARRPAKAGETREPADRLLTESREPGAIEPEERVPAGPPRVGDTVLISPLGQTGVLIAEPDGGKAQVQIGAMRMTVAASALTRVAPTREAAPSQSRAVGDLRLERRATVSPEIQLLGLRAREAVETLDSYLDDVCLAGISPVRVVHGKGTGALQRAVWEYLQKHPHVSAYRLGEEGEGGGGVTIVSLKEE
jgi:DNA mismatch repair protein MutS2